MDPKGFLLEFMSAGQVIRVLCDPIFADRASPSKHLGPKRRLPPPCSVEELPEIHFLVISHNQCVLLILTVQQYSIC